MSKWQDFKYRNKFTVVLTHPIWTIKIIKVLWPIAKEKAKATKEDSK